MRCLGALFCNFWPLDDEFEDIYDKEVGYGNSNPKMKNEIDEEQVPL